MIWLLFFVVKVSAQDAATPLKMPPPLPPSNECGVFPPPPTFYKYWHEKCSNSTECFGNPYAMACKDGLCECNEDYEPDPNPPIGPLPPKRTCVPLPYLFNKCKDKCHRPAQCLPFNNDPDKVCQCVDPYILIQGDCILECNQTQVYDPQLYECVPRCKADEVKINNTCQPLVNLGQKCDSDKQCQAQFAECNNGTCTCKAGFKANGTLCSPKEYVCPIGEALKASNSVVFCNTFFEQKNQSSDSQSSSTKLFPPIIPRPPPNLKDDCPQGYFCLIPGSNYAQDNQHGYCCPNVIKECPVGSPHPTLKCGVQGPGNQYCPYETYYCHSIQFGSFHKEVCCPKPCSSEEVLVDNDKCLPSVRLDGNCLINEQCTDSYAECRNGTCQCENGAKRAGNSLFPYCLKQCQFDEVLQGKQCVKRKKLNDTCSPDESYLCPENAICNQENRCVCQCNMILLAPNVCAPQPSCPFNNGPIPRYIRPTLPPEQHHFCHVRDLDPPPGVNATKCPHGEYCTYYMSHLGQCCPKAPRNCPTTGQPPDDDSCCDPTNPLSCDSFDEMCVKYISPVDEDPDSRNNTFCCPKYGSGPIPID
uniref:EB domain-containing protein n=1 Tax=Romanomermis culicivorax TaxID=13658 RepID=A0A915IJ26_ROMCU